MDSQSDLLTIREVADQLGIHPDTVRHLLQSGRLKGIRLGANQSEWRGKHEQRQRGFTLTVTGPRPAQAVLLDAVVARQGLADRIVS